MRKQGRKSIFAESIDEKTYFPKKELLFFKKPLLFCLVCVIIPMFE